MAKVSDFGLSKLLPENNNNKGSMFPAEQAPAGTVTHMSPEALAEGALSTAADVYAFGIMSERMLIYHKSHQPSRCASLFRQHH